MNQAPVSVGEVVLITQALINLGAIVGGWVNLQRRLTALETKMDLLMAGKTLKNG